MSDRRIVIHRGKPRWFTYEGRVYHLGYGGSRGWGYEVWDAETGQTADSNTYAYLDDIRRLFRGPEPDETE